MRWTAAFLAAVAACGGGGGGADAGPGLLPDAPPVIDIDASPVPDAPPIVDWLPDFHACQVNEDCKPTSDCVSVPWIADGWLPWFPPMESRRCLPRCDNSAECAFGMFCYSEVAPLGPEFFPMRHHCWRSMCGELLDNGQTGGACQLGVEAGVTDGRDGYCRPIDDGRYGMCQEVGNVPIGGTCATNELFWPPDPNQKCDFDGACEGTGDLGTCIQRCDPRGILTGDPTGCPPGAACRDSSQAYVAAGGVVLRATAGLCQAGGLSCGTLGPNICPDSAAGLPQACKPTNPVHPTGLCFTDPAQPICPLPYPAGDMTCTPGTTCTPELWHPGADGTPGTLDDIYTITWGLCQ